MTNSIKSITIAVEKGEDFSPFLFLCPDDSALRIELNSIISLLKEEYQLPSTSIFDLDMLGESIKIEEVRKFVQKGNVRSSFPIQIFIIRDIGNLTLGSSNALLKFLEEPGPGNIIFLTNSSDSKILDTIISRVQIKNIGFSSEKKYDSQIKLLIESYMKDDNTEILDYYYSKKIQKQDGIIFLYSLIECIHKIPRHMNMLGDIEKSINGITANNYVSKFIIDQYLLKLKK